MPRRFRFYAEEILGAVALVLFFWVMFVGFLAFDADPEAPPHDAVAPEGASGEEK